MGEVAKRFLSRTTRKTSVWIWRAGCSAQHHGEAIIHDSRDVILRIKSFEWYQQQRKRSGGKFKTCGIRFWKTQCFFGVSPYTLTQSLPIYIPWCKSSQYLLKTLWELCFLCVRSIRDLFSRNHYTHSRLETLFLASFFLSQYLFANGSSSKLELDITIANWAGHVSQDFVDLVIPQLSLHSFLVITSVNANDWLKKGRATIYILGYDSCWSRRVRLTTVRNDRSERKYE